MPALSRPLLNWYKKNARALPWRNHPNPYAVWVSEIMLQQTRVDTVIAYFEKWMNLFPTIKTLAQADERAVLNAWEGLGYYTRCKNLLYTARLIDKEYNGIFPDAYEKIAALKGVGPYTAAAISSFCFNLPYAVVDGNVFRILSRIAGNMAPIDSTEGKKIFTQLATKALDKENPGMFNQAIMDFGALVCKPFLPLCAQCVLNKIWSRSVL